MSNLIGSMYGIFNICLHVVIVNVGKKNGKCQYTIHGSSWKLILTTKFLLNLTFPKVEFTKIFEQILEQILPSKLRLWRSWESSFSAQCAPGRRGSIR